MSRTLALGAALLLVGASVTGCGADPGEEYCAAVEEHQAALTDLVGEGGPDALLSALTIFRDLQEQAPRDIGDEWDLVVGRVASLDDALRSAEVDPTTYDRDAPPADLDAADRVAVDAAARELAAPATGTALAGLEQQARDVCGTPLVL